MPVESFDDDEYDQEGPKSSFGTYLAEGDTLFKQSEYKKALESYSLALELEPTDKTCLVARSKCYLKLGDSQKALEDAEAALAEDKEFNKGLYRKAEALYCMGDFEYALMYYHRGYKLRPELEEFRLGIQKAQEAIDNSIGSAAKIKLENKGDLSFFAKQDELGSKKRGYTKPLRNIKLKPNITQRNKDTKNPTPSKKTVKQLLGELYADKEYLEKLMNDQEFIQVNSNRPIYDLVQGGLNYLETRTEFWRQQKPLYARKKDKSKTGAKARPSIPKYVLKQLEEIDAAFANNNIEDSLRLAMSLLKAVEDTNESNLPNKMEILANIHSCIGNAQMELNQLPKALKSHQKDLEVSTGSNLKDGKSRALDNIGRVYARMGKYEKAVKSWSEKLPLLKTSLEGTWLFHEIGRCHLEMHDYEEAKDFGQKSLSAAKECEDDIWQLNATVLIAQALVKLNKFDDGMKAFNDALLLAISLSDDSAQTAISKAIDDLKRKITAADVKDETSETSDNDDIERDQIVEYNDDNTDKMEGFPKDKVVSDQEDDENAETEKSEAEPEECDGVLANESVDNSHDHTPPPITEDTGRKYTSSADDAQKKMVAEMNDKPVLEEAEGYAEVIGDKEIADDVEDDANISNDSNCDKREELPTDEIAEENEPILILDEKKDIEDENSIIAHENISEKLDNINSERDDNASVKEEPIDNIKSQMSKNSIEEDKATELCDDTQTDNEVGSDEQNVQNVHAESVHSDGSNKEVDKAPDNK